MSWQEDPDRALHRFQAEENERFELERRKDRIADYTPSSGFGGLQGSADTGHGSGHRAGSGDGRAAGVTSAMVSLAHTVLNGSWHDARDASRVLAEMVLEAGE